MTLLAAIDPQAAVQIGPQGVAISLGLVVLAIVVSWRRQLGLERPLVEATVRALAQLVAVGYALRVLFDPAVSVWWSVGWVGFMVLFAAWTIDRRVEQVDGLVGLATLATGLAALVTLGAVFALGVFPFEARYLVPLAGMMIGNPLKAGVLAVRRTVDELAEQRAAVEARVALGQSWRQASQPFARRALRDALTPQVETTRAVGLVFLPGAMTGLILAGVDPIDAVLVQAAIMFLILGGVAITSLVLVLGTVRRLFTDDDRLRPLVRERG
jgi:putative ABC transport system permease protein